MLLRFWLLSSIYITLKPKEHVPFSQPGSLNSLVKLELVLPFVAWLVNGQKMVGLLGWQG